MYLPQENMFSQEQKYLERKILKLFFHFNCYYAFSVAQVLDEMLQFADLGLKRPDVLGVLL